MKLLVSDLEMMLGVMSAHKAMLFDVVTGPDWIEFTFTGGKFRIYQRPEKT